MFAIANAYWLVRRRDDAAARPAMHAVIEWIKSSAAHAIELQDEFHGVSLKYDRNFGRNFPPGAQCPSNRVAEAASKPPFAIVCLGSAF